MENRYNVKAIQMPYEEYKHALQKLEYMHMELGKIAENNVLRQEVSSIIEILRGVIVIDD